VLSFQLSAFVVYDKMLADLETNKLKLAIVYVTMTVVATINPLLVRKSVDGGVSFNVVVVESLGEFMKLVVATSLFGYEQVSDSQFSANRFWESLTGGALIDFVVTVSKSWPLFLVPGLAYLIQNSIYNLSVAAIGIPVLTIVFQITIPLSCVVSRLVLGRKLNSKQWIAVGSLTIGSMLGTSSQLLELQFSQTFLIGILLALCMVCTSVGAGTFLEFLYNRHGLQSSLQGNNIRLYSAGVAWAWFYMLVNYDTFLTEGLFYNWNMWIWIGIGWRCVMGQMIGLIMKYVGNADRVVINSVARILVVIIGVFHFHDAFSIHLVIAFVVTFSSFGAYMYLKEDTVAAVENIPTADTEATEV
jgi:drug/metabolite transporter (DMT)-like permease